MDNLIDAYAHVGLPRFQSLTDYWEPAVEVGIGKAVLSAFDASPDLGYLISIARAEPERFRVLGVPVGQGPERRKSVRAQLRAGFTGIRLTGRDIAGADDVLDEIGEEGGVAVICGGTVTSQPAGALALLAHLEKHATAIVVGGHFGAPREPLTLADGPVRDLFRHPRFYVTFSRHGAFDADLLQAWVEAVLEQTGWGRVMWGSESPVLHWRNETLGSAVAWIDRFAPTPEQRCAFFGDNALRVFFESTLHAEPLQLDVEPWDTAPQTPAVLWSNGLPVDQKLAGRLLHSWRISPHRESTLGEHLACLLEGALPGIQQSSPNPAQPQDASLR